MSNINDDSKVEVKQHLAVAEGGSSFNVQKSHESLSQGKPPLEERLWGAFQEHTIRVSAIALFGIFLSALLLWSLNEKFGVKEITMIDKSSPLAHEGFNRSLQEADPLAMSIILVITLVFMTAVSLVSFMSWSSYTSSATLKRSKSFIALALLLIFVSFQVVNVGDTFSNARFKSHQSPAFNEWSEARYGVQLDLDKKYGVVQSVVPIELDDGNLLTHIYRDMDNNLIFSGLDDNSRIYLYDSKTLKELPLKTMPAVSP